VLCLEACLERLARGRGAGVWIGIGMRHQGRPTSEGRK
jgi:hypothetical protein